MALAAVVLVVVHPGISLPATNVENANSTEHVVEITGHAELAGGPVAVGEQSAGTHGYSGIIAVYTRSTTPGTPVLEVPVSPKHDSYKLTLHQSGTYYLVPQTPDGMQQAASSEQPQNP